MSASHAVSIGSHQIEQSYLVCLSLKFTSVFKVIVLKCLTDSDLYLHSPSVVFRVFLALILSLSDFFPALSLLPPATQMFTKTQQTNIRNCSHLLTCSCQYLWVHHWNWTCQPVSKLYSYHQSIHSASQAVDTAASYPRDGNHVRNPISNLRITNGDQMF